MMVHMLRVATVLTICASVVYGMHNVTLGSDDISLKNGRTNLKMLSYAWYNTSGCDGSSYTYAKGAYFQLTFTGVAVWIAGAWSPYGGIINFVLDGGAPTQVDVYAPTKECYVIWFVQQGLANTTHTLTGTLNANSPENMNASPGPYMEITSAAYTVLDPGDVVLSSSSVSATSTSTSALSTSSTSSTASTSSSTPSATTSTSSSAKGGISATKLGVGIAAALVLAAVLAFLFVFLRRRYKRRGRSIHHLDGSTDLDGAAMMEPLILQGGPERKDSRGSAIDVDVALQNSEPWSPERTHGQSPSYAMSMKSPGATDGIDSTVTEEAGYGYGYEHGMYKPAPATSPPIVVRAPTVSGPRARPESWISTRSDATTHYPQSSAGGDYLSTTSHSQHSPHSIADTDVDRIAARVALMISNRHSWDPSSGQEPPPEVDWTGGGEFIPPPSYNNVKRPSPPG